MVWAAFSAIGKRQRRGGSGSGAASLTAPSSRSRATRSASEPKDSTVSAACSDFGDLAAVVRACGGGELQVNSLTGCDQRHGQILTFHLFGCLRRHHARSGTSGGACGIVDARMPHRCGGEPSVTATVATGCTPMARHRCSALGRVRFWVVMLAGMVIQSKPCRAGRRNALVRLYL